MNLTDSPTEDQLQQLLVAYDDSSANHLLWVSRHGEVNVEALTKGLTPIGFVKSRPDMQFRYEAFAQGNNQVGLAAANDKKWVARIFKSLVKEWETYKGVPSCVYIDFF